MPGLGQSSSGGSYDLPAFFRPRLSRLLLGSLIALLAAFIVPSSALAIDEFSQNLTPGARPAGITVGPDGALWFTEETANKIGRITTAGVITEHATTSGAPSEIVTGPDGKLWYTTFTGGRIGRLDPANPSAVDEWPTPTSGSGPDGITVGPDGAIWFTESQWHKIGRIDPFNPGPVGSSSGIREFAPDSSTPGFSPNSGPGDIAVGPDNRLWFTEFMGHRVGVINILSPSAITVNEFPVGTGPSAITASGGFLWFTQAEGNSIGRISATGQGYTPFPVPTPVSQPSGIALGPPADGALWFTESDANKIGRMTPSGSFTEFVVPSVPPPNPGGLPEGPDGIVLGPDGMMWFTEKGAGKIGRIQPSGGGGGTVPPPPPPVTQTAKPSVLSLRVSPKAFRAAPKGASISAKVGAKVTYRLSIAASTRFTVERESAGRKKGKKCVKPTRKLRRAKRCKLYKAVRGSFTHKGKAGSNSFRFSGRVGNKKLRPGRYRLVALATAGTAKSALKQASFRIVKR